MSKPKRSDGFLEEHQEWIRHAQNPHHNLGRFDSYKRRRMLVMPSGSREGRVLYPIVFAIVIFFGAVLLNSYMQSNTTLGTIICVSGMIIPFLLVGWSIYQYKHR